MIVKKMVLLIVLASCCASLAAQPSNIGDIRVRPKQPLYERELFVHNLAIDLAFRTLPGPAVSFERGELLYFDQDGNSMGRLEITPFLFTNNQRIFVSPNFQDAASTTIQPNRTVLVMLPVLQFPRKQSPARIEARFWFQGFGQALEFPEIRPLAFLNNQGRYHYPMVPSPFPEGDWLTSQGHALRNPAHRRSAVFAGGALITLQRYADDFEIFANGSRMFGNPSPPTSYYAYGQPVVAIDEGVVLRAVDNVVDNNPVLTVATPGYGNNLHIDHQNGEISHYVHLKSGSVRVQVGQRVSRGEVIAEVGNSGSSSYPHIHFEVALSLQRDPNPVGPFHTEGVPFYPADIRMLGSRQIRTVLPSIIPFQVVDPPEFPQLATDISGPGTVAESEPNNDLRAAQALSLPVRVEGNIQLGEASDWADSGDVIEDIFRFDLSEAGIVSIRVESDSGADLDLLLLDSRQHVVAEASGDQSSEEILAELESGIYFLFLSEFGDPSLPGPQSGYTLDVALLDQQLLFAHYGQGEGIASTLFLINPSPQDEAAALLDLRSAAGGAFAAQRARQKLAGQPVLRIPPLGMLRLPSAAGGELQTGSALLLSSPPVAGAILFGGDSGLAAVAGIGARNGFLAPIEMDSARQVRTGVAIANPEEDSLQVTLRLRDAEGVPLPGAEVQLDLPPRGQLARFADEFFVQQGLDLSTFRGTLQATSDGPAAGMVLRESPAELATFPVTALEPAAAQHSVAEAPSTLYFPHFAGGPGISSNLILINPSAEPLSVGLHLFNQQGDPLSKALQAEVAPLGVRFLSLPESPALTIGWARLEADGFVGAALLLEGEFGSAGVAASLTASQVLSPVETDLPSGVRTGVAFANPNPSPSEILLQLRDESGQPVENGQQTIHLPAQGQSALQVDEIFSAIDWTSFSGVLQATSDQPLAATVIRLSPGQFATLPVVMSLPSEMDQ